MFIEDFVAVRRNVLITNAWLISHGEELIRAAAPVATGWELGTPRTRADVLVLPLNLNAARPSPFTDFQGDLQTARLEPEVTHLSLSGSCDIHVEPPGRRPQEHAAQRVAEQAIREFLGRLAVLLEARSGPPPD